MVEESDLISDIKVRNAVRNVCQTAKTYGQCLDQCLKQEYFTSVQHNVLHDLDQALRKSRRTNKQSVCEQLRHQFSVMLQEAQQLERARLQQAIVPLFHECSNVLCIDCQKWLERPQASWPAFRRAQVGYVYAWRDDELVAGSKLIVSEFEVFLEYKV